MRSLGATECHRIFGLYRLRTRSWLVWADKRGSSFVRAIAEAAVVADLNPNRENEGGGSVVREIDE